MTDPDGRDSIYVNRPLGKYGNTESTKHGFIVVTSVDKDGKHTLRQRFSFGPVDKEGGDDPLRNVTGSGDSTDTTDGLYTQDVLINLNSGAELPDGVDFTTIDADDDVTVDVGNRTIGNDDYETVPSVFPGGGANSNSGARSVAERARAGSPGAEKRKPVVVPKGWSPGHKQWEKVEIEDKK